MTTNDRLSDEQIDFAIRMEPPGSGIARALHEVQSSRATLAAIEALHQPTPKRVFCQHCLAVRWPCPTARLLHPNPEEDR